MKKRIFSFILAAILIVSLLPISALAAVTSLSNVTFTVAANKEAGLGGDVKISFTKSGSNYNGTLYLPGGVDTSKLALSWDEGVNVKVNNTAYASGEAPVPANGTSMTYAVTVGSSTANYTVKTMQGSAGVEGMFLTIDESKGTISAMNGDKNHETECFGQVTFAGDTNFISMKGRGNSTWSQKKKPYNITFYKAGDYNKKQKVELIEDVESKKWSLLANYLDNSLIRNKIGYDLADSLGIGLKSRFVDVWMNGEYIGNYLITPKNDYLASDDGFILELDNKPTDDDPQFTLNGLPAPSSAYLSSFTVKSIGDESGLSVDDVKDWMATAWKAIQNYDSDDYLNYIDLNSWAKMYLANEIYRNMDILSGSIFMHREGTADTDKLIAGPVWDLDLAIGRSMTSGFSGMNSNTQRAADNWYIDNINSSGTRYVCWFQELAKHKSFMSRVYEIYNEYATEFATMETNTAAQAELIKDSAALDSSIWGNIITSAGDYVSSAATYGSGAYAVRYEKTTSREIAVNNLKAYVSARLKFLSENLTVTAPVGSSITGTTTYAVGDGVSLTADCTANTYQWQSSVDGETWTDIEGATAKTYSATALYTMNNVQFRCVAKNVGDTINTTRVAKVAPAAATTLAPVTLTVSLEGHEHHYNSVVTAPTCTEQGYTTYTCSCGDSYVDDYTDALGHNFVDGQCTRCPEKDPDYIPQCIVDRNVSLTAGTFTFTLGGHELGEYTFSKSGNNWTIKDGDGKYLGFANRALSDNAFGWTYSNGRFQTSVTTTTTTSSGGWGGFFGWGGSRNRTTTTTTTYYLAYTGGRITVSTGTSGTNAGFTQHIENLNHSFGAWTQAANGQHARTCSVCGFVSTADCAYGADHSCAVCGRIDPNLVYVTAAFVTGNGASAAPAAQTVIKGEGLIVKPVNDPTKIGSIFVGWYVGDVKFTFDTTISESVTITAKWTQCDAHDYDKETHICAKCGAKDPEAIAYCSGDKTVSLTAGKLNFTLGGHALGEYTFARSGNGWTIKDQNGKYLGFANNALSDNAFGWTYSNGRFQTSVTTTTGGGNTGWGGFGWGWGGSSRTTTTTCYLAYVNGNITVSTGTTGANAAFTIHVESDEHSGAWKTVGKTHTRKCEVCGTEETEPCSYGADHRCTVCGGYDPDAAVVNVSVSKSQRTSGNSGWGFGWSWGGSSRTTTYTATITATAIGTTVTKVEYSTNGTSWTSGSTVTSNSQIRSFLIRVTDSNGTKHNYSYDGTSVIPQ